MRYELSKDRIKRAKEIIKALETRKAQWEKSKQEALEERKKNKVKYYKVLTDRINYAENKIKEIEDKILEFNKVIQEGYIEI